jgi:HAD superfamily hydrolase (TIGR01509 family)
MKEKLLMTNAKKLIIFDCDGVLVDSEMIANRVDAQFFTDLGYPISIEESIKRFTGMSAKAMENIIFEESGIRLSSNIWRLRREDILKAFEKELKPLMLEILSSDFIGNIDKCLASSGLREHVIMSLRLTNQLHFFKNECIFTSAQVKNGKPAPDLFLFSADKMGYLPQNCLVIEDSMAGIQAALAAKMHVIGFLGGSHAQFEWYQESINNQNIPVARNAQELLPMIKDFINK